MAQWGRKHWSGFHRPKPISPPASGKNKAISQNDENNFFRPVMQWTKTEEGWYLKTSAKPKECIKQRTACSRLWFKDAKRNCMQHHHKWLSTLWERKRWLSLFTHNLLFRVIRSQQTPTLKASKTQPWQISLPDLMPTRTTFHNKSDAVSYKLQSSVLTRRCTTNRSRIWLFHGKATS